jgi:hypothetical protein
MFSREPRTWNLEDEIAKKKKSTKQGCFRAGNMKGFSQTCGGTKAVIGAIEICQAVCNENGGEDICPSFFEDRSYFALLFGERSVTGCLIGWRERIHIPLSITG